MVDFKAKVVTLAMTTNKNIPRNTLEKLGVIRLLSFVPFTLRADLLTEYKKLYDEQC